VFAVNYLCERYVWVLGSGHMPFLGYS
jgi:hypothetical protein